jgi:dihydrofolate reductase
VGKVVFEITMSLDGFVCGPNNELDRLHAWMFNDPDPIDAGIAGDFARNSGAVIMGNGTFTDGVNQQGWEGWVDNPPFTVPTFVLAHGVPPKLEAGKTIYTFVTGGIEDALAQAKAAAGAKTVTIMGGANIAQQYLNAGLLDEIYMHIAPLMLGEGKRLFDPITFKNIALEQISSVPSSRMTHIRYRILKEN